MSQHANSALIALAMITAGSLAATERLSQIGIEVKDPRPLAAAADLLESRYSLVFTYEDPPYRHGSDLQPLPGSNKGGPPRVIPGGTELRLDPAAVMNRSVGLAGPADLARALVEAHAAALQPGRFRVAAEATAVHFIPTEIKSGAGLLKPLTPVLDTPVLLVSGERSATEVFLELCREISRSAGVEVRPGLAPVNRMHQTRLAVDTAEAPAREVLARIGAALEAPLSWRLFYEPNRGYYLLHLHIVSPKVQQVRVLGPEAKR